MDKVHQDDRKAAKTPILIYIAKLNGCILQTGLWQNECQQPVNNFWFCILDNHSGASSQTSINEELASIIGRQAGNIPTTAFRTVTTDIIYYAVGK